MHEQRRIKVPANEGRSFEISAGEFLTIVDIEGYQIGDLVFFSAVFLVFSLVVHPKPIWNQSFLARTFHLEGLGSAKSYVDQNIKKNDVVGIWIMDYTYTVLDQNPETAAPSAGARTRWSIQKFGSTTPAVLTITAGGKKDEVPDKERIEKDFTINSFADITKQRTRFTKDGAIVDQVPFLLGTKGPLSLRGRQFGDDGKPISVTVEPPNTSKS